MPHPSRPAIPSAHRKNDGALVRRAIASWRAFLAGAVLIAMAAFSTTAYAEDANSGVEAETVAQLSTAERQEVQGIVREYISENPEFIRDYLLKNPGVLREAMEALQTQEAEAARAGAVAAIQENRELLFSSPRQVVVGNPSGDVTLVEFFDYNCGYCRRAHADMVRLIEADPNLRIVLKEFPILGDESTEAASVSIAVRMLAPEQSAAFHTALITQPGQANAAVAIAVAEQLGIERSSLEAAMKSEEVQSTLSESYALAQALSVSGTPAYVTLQGVISGAVGFDALQKEISDTRMRCAPPATC